MINNLSLQKNNLENETNDLEKLIKILTFNMNDQIKKFKTHSLNYYYKELLKLEEDTDKFGKDLENLWESTLDNDNIKKL